MLHIKRYRLAAFYFWSVSALYLCGCGVKLHPGQHAGASSATKAVTLKVPAITTASNVQDIASYVDYYKGKGFVVTQNKQAFDSDGQVLTFQFAASKRTGAFSERITAAINAATDTISTSSSSVDNTVADSQKGDVTIPYHNRGSQATGTDSKQHLNHSVTTTTTTLKKSSPTWTVTL